MKAIYLLLFMLFCAGISYAAAPAMQSASISPETAYTNDTLVGYCNATGSEELAFHYRWYQEGSLFSSGYTQWGYVYQENSNAKTANDKWVDASRIYDGNWGTQSQATTSTTAYLEVNYTKDSLYSYGTKWQAKLDLIDSKFNLTIPRTCFTHYSDVIRLRIQAIDGGSDYSNYQCFNGTWSTFTQKNKDILTEEAIYWKYGMYNNSIEANINNISSDNTSRSNEWIFSCLAFNGTTNSTWMNSSTLTISNTAPAYSGVVNISPSSPTHLQNLTCNNESVFTDADSDPITLQYKWYKSDIFQNITDRSLLFGNTTTDDLWKCSIIPTDGTDNGTEVFSNTVSINTGKVAPVISRTNATTEGINSTASYPSNRNETVNLSVMFTDTNNDTWTTFFCKTSGATASGCTGVKWCNTSSYTDSKVQSCLITDLAGLSLGTSYNYWAYTIDNETLVSSGVSGTFYVGDDIDPVLSGIYTSQTSMYNDEILYMYANCTDTESVASVKFWVYTYFDNGATYNANITTSSPLTGDKYMVLKAVSSNGIWGLRRIYCLDDSGNVASNSTSINVTVSTRPTEPEGGGGGDTTIIEMGGTKEACLITLSQDFIIFNGGNPVEEIKITNNDNKSYAPTFEFVSVEGNLEFEITNTIGTILLGSTGSFGVLHAPAELVPGEAILKLVSTNCNDINITLMVQEGTRTISIFKELFGGELSFWEILKEPIFSERNSLREKLPLICIGMVALFVFLLLTAALIKLIADSIKEGRALKTIVIFAFILIITPITTVFIVTGFRIYY